MHFMARDTGEFSAAKTGRRLHTVELSAGYPNHAVAPESIPKKIRFGPVDEILLFAMVRRVWLNDETLREIVSAGAESGAMAVELNLIRHVIESPHAVTLTACER